MRRILLEAPAAEPVTLAEAKAHLRLDGAEEDELVALLVAAARVAVETEIRRALVAQRWRAVVDDWPRDGLHLPVAPLISVDAARAFDAAGTEIPLAAGDDYQLDPLDGSLRLVAPLPGAVRSEIDFTAGYGATGADVPQPLRQAVRLLVTYWYEHRGAAAEAEPRETPFGYRELLAPYRRLVLC